MAAAILTPETITLHNIPYVRDIITMRRLIEDIGGHVLTPELRTHKISAAHIELQAAPYDLVKTMRASVLALGPLIARFGKARVSLPGGCAKSCALTLFGRIATGTVRTSARLDSPYARLSGATAPS